MQPEDGVINADSSIIFKTLKQIYRNAQTLMYVCCNCGMMSVMTP